jgi:hypothetical protein
MRTIQRQAVRTAHSTLSTPRHSISADYRTACGTLGEAWQRQSKRLIAALNQSKSLFYKRIEANLSR